MKKIKDNAIFVVDGTSILYRSYYAIKALHTSKGLPVQAVYGFCRSIKKIIDEFNPKYLLIAWDKGKSIRKETFTEYKAKRESAPIDMFDQKEAIVEFLDLIKAKQIEKSGYEADDLILSIVEDHKKNDAVVVAQDKDLFQLISDRVVNFDPSKKIIIDEEVFEKKYGFMPEKLSFYHALIGDSIDNIPGVRGVGEKTAKKLVIQFDSLEDLYNNLEKVESEKTRNLLEKSKDDAFMSLDLFLLKKAPIKVDLKEMEFNKENWANANQLFKELEFKSLIIEDSEKNEEIKFETKKTSWKCIIVKTEESLKELVADLKKQTIIALDTETTGPDPMLDDLVGISFAFDKKNAYYIPIRHKDNGQLDIELILNELRPILENSKIEKTLHNAKFDKLVLSNIGVELNGITFDTILAANLLRKSDEKIGLKKLSVRLLDEKMTSFAELTKKKYKSFSYVPIEDGAEYSAHDSLQTFKLQNLFEKEIDKEKKLKKIFDDLEMPLMEVLVEMEKEGIALDVEKLKDVGQIVERRLKNIADKIFATLGYGETKALSFNLNSSKQVEKLLFDDLKLEPVKKSPKGKRSTDQEVLIKLAQKHPIPGMILEYRELYKMNSTYITSLPKTINPRTGRIHTSFSQTKTATGRLASSEPNLQNIPAKEGIGTQIRSAFVAERGKQFISADYSQIELRVLAHITKDKNLIEAFNEGIDIHKQTASQIFQVPIDKVTTIQRQIGKRINFSIIYGLTPFGLSKDLGIKLSEAKAYIDKFFEQYPNVFGFLESTVEKAKKTGYTETLMGRRRYLPGLQEKNRTMFEASRRMAINSPVQGTSAEIIKMAMINLKKQFESKKMNSKMILQIHDELLFEVPNDELEKAEKLIQHEMESVVKWEIPLEISIRSGKNWAESSK